MYVSQVGGMHPTGMFFDVYVIVIVTARMKFGAR